MESLLFFYSIFGVALLGLMIGYQISARREKNDTGFEDSSVWMYGIIIYFMMLLNVGVESFRVIQNYYLFFFLSLVLSFLMISDYIDMQIVVPKRMHWVVVFFMGAWVIIGGYQGIEPITIITPLMYMQGIIYFLVGLKYLLDEEYELSVRNMTGILFLIFSMIKIGYIAKRDFSELFINSVFITEFVIYVVIGFVLIMFDSNKHENQAIGNGRLIMESIDRSPLGILLLNHRGDVIGINEEVTKKLSQTDFFELSNGNLNVGDFAKMPFDEEWDKILQTVTKSGSYSLEADIDVSGEIMTYEFLFLPSAKYSDLTDPYGLNLNIVCLVLSQKRQYSIVKSVSKIEQDDYVMPNRYKLMELFDIGIHQKLKKHFGVILIKIVNYDGITNIVNSHEIATIDQMIHKKLDKLEYVYCIGKVSQDTFEIITEDILDSTEIIEFLNIVKDILNHQSFYDSDMNVYSLDYRIGIAMAPEDGYTQRELLRHASIAVTKATREEKGYIQFFNDHIKHELATELQLETKLRDSIEAGELFLEFQPQFVIDGSEIRGFEALIRWRLPDGSIKSPDEFVPLAENMGLMDDLGDWIIENSIVEATLWHQRYKKEWTLSINVSVAQIEQEGFADSVLKMIDKYEYPHHLLEIEITETKMTTSSDRVFIELKTLRDHGVNIAIDDFGTGYASLDYLRWVPFDVLKIDKGFIDNLDHDNIDFAIVSSVIDLVGKMKGKTIAEGVETVKQLELLKQTGLDYIQGYIYGRPMTKEAIHDLLEENRD